MLIINPLDNFKKSLLKTIIIKDKKFTVDISLKYDIYNKLSLLSRGLISIDNIKLEDIDSVKEDISSGIDKEEAIKNEIGSWDSRLTDILYTKYLELLSQYQNIDFDKETELRLYWKIRKIFSRDEIDNWSEVDWRWAYYNIFKDEEEQNKFDDTALEKRKPWYNYDLWKGINKNKQDEEMAKEQEKIENKKFIEDILKKQNPNVKVDFELVDDDTPIIIEGK